MPEPLSEDEIEEIVDDAIAEVGATSMRDLGRVMADVMPRIAGRADGSTVSQLVNEKLAACIFVARCRQAPVPSDWVLKLPSHGPPGVLGGRVYLAARAAARRG